MVAWHEMPGNASQATGPGGYGMIARRGSTIVLGVNKTSRLGSYRSLRDGPCLPVTQAFHAWLPSRKRDFANSTPAFELGVDATEVSSVDGA